MLPQMVTFVPSSLISGDQFSGTSNRDFAVSIHDKNPPPDSVSVPACDNKLEK